MAKSAYYGSRGDAVKQIQRDLNAQGANLEVDGIWGEKTEQWYNKIMNGGNYDPPSDAEILQQAEAGFAVEPSAGDVRIALILGGGHPEVAGVSRLTFVIGGEEPGGGRVSAEHGVGKQPALGVQHHHVVACLAEV